MSGWHTSLTGFVNRSCSCTAALVPPTMAHSWRGWRIYAGMRKYFKVTSATTSTQTTTMVHTNMLEIVWVFLCSPQSPRFNSAASRSRSLSASCQAADPSSRAMLCVRQNRRHGLRVVASIERGSTSRQDTSQ